MQKIGINLLLPEASMLRGIITTHLEARELQEGEILIETNYDAGTIELVDEDTGDSLCILPAHLFSTEFRDAKSISVKTEANLDLYSGTDYPKSFKSLMNIFIDDILQVVKPNIGRHIVSIEFKCEDTIVITGDYGAMDFLAFIPKHFDGFLSSFGDDLDFIVDIQQTFKVNKK